MKLFFAAGLELALEGESMEGAEGLEARLAAKAAEADCTSLGFSTGAGGSADFGISVSST